MRIIVLCAMSLVFQASIASVASTVKLKSSDGAEFVIPRAVAQNDTVSNMLADGLKLDPAADEFVLNVPADIARRIIPVLQFIHEERIAAFAPLVTSRSFKLHEIDGLLGTINAQLLPEYIKAADYLGAPIVRDALIWRYAKLSAHERRQNPLHFSRHADKTFNSLIARGHFLQTGQDIERDLKVAPQTYSFDELKLWGRLPGSILQKFPDWSATNPNPTNNLQETPLGVAASLNDFKAVQAILKVPGTDVNKGGALCWAGYHDNVEIARALLNKLPKQVDGKRTKPARCSMLAGDRPLVVAAGSRGQEALDLLLREIPFDQEDTSLALLAAYQSGNWVNTLRLLDAGAEFPRKTRANQEWWDTRPQTYDERFKERNKQAQVRVRERLQKMGRTDISVSH